VPPTTSEHLEQDNATEHAPKEEVVQCFDTLITEGAHDAILQAMPVMPIPGPVMTVNCQPAKESHIVQRFGLPQLLGTQDGRLADEQCCVR
jgi:hypothetical protein